MPVIYPVTPKVQACIKMTIHHGNTFLVQKGKLTVPNIDIINETT